MYPFDPAWEFEQMVIELNERYGPGTVTSGRARNALVWAWALHVGNPRAVRELEAAISRHGSQKNLAQEIRMSVGTLREFRRYVSQLPERSQLPQNEQAMREAFSALPDTAQLDFLRVAAQLIQQPNLIGRLASPAVNDVGRLLRSALRAEELRSATDQLREHLDSGESRESVYQSWCDDHSWVFGGAHRLRDLARRIHDTSIVELLLPDVVGFRNIVELKRPSMEVLAYDRSHKTYYFSSEVAKAVGQVHKYMDKLHELARKGLDNIRKL